MTGIDTPISAEVSGAAASGSAALRFRHEALQAHKGFWDGAQRLRPPEETLEWLRPHFATIGLTRLANVTGLDRIGIPVVLSVRPNSGYLSVDAGKGVTMAAATTSAAMECFERHAAEWARPPEVVATWDELGPDRVPLDLLPLAKSSLFRPDRPERWTVCWDLAGQGEVPAPTLSITMERHRRQLSDPISFQLGSNGLASGNELVEAMTSGILELVERDAVACRQLAWERWGTPPPRVRLDTIEHPVALTLLEILDAAGVSVVLFDCTVDTGVPVYMAYIIDRLVPGMGLYRGYGAHLDPGIAMVRALTEAAQGRLVFIAGSRDDTFRHHHRLLSDDRRTIAVVEGIEATVDVGDRRPESTATFDQDVAILVDKLRRAGLEQVLVYDLTDDRVGVPAVRVLIPGLEGYRFETYSPGPRAAAWLRDRSTEVQP